MQFTSVSLANVSPSVRDLTVECAMSHHTMSNESWKQDGRMLLQHDFQGVAETTNSAGECDCNAKR